MEAPRVVRGESQTERCEPWLFRLASASFARAVSDAGSTAPCRSRPLKNRQVRDPNWERCTSPTRVRLFRMKRCNGMAVSTAHAVQIHDWKCSNRTQSAPLPVSHSPTRRLAPCAVAHRGGGNTNCTHACRQRQLSVTTPLLHIANKGTGSFSSHPLAIRRGRFSRAWICQCSFSCSCKPASPGHLSSLAIISRSPL